MNSWFNQSLVPKCVETAEFNRITGIQSRIRIPRSQRGVGDFRLGRWVKRRKLKSRPLFTRYQPAGCVEPSRKGGYIPINPVPEWCSLVTDRDIANFSTGTFVGLPEYEFHWGEKRKESEVVASLHDVYYNQSWSATHKKICVVGDSHSRFVVTRSAKALGVRGIMVYVKQQWPDPFSIQSKLLERHCESVLIQIGQWQASWIAGSDPFSFGRYYTQMRVLVDTILKVLEYGNVTNPKIYLPTHDLSPLMGAVNACKDWRTPTVMSTYSYILQLIASEFENVEFIDTNFIIQTHWDGNPDW